MQLRASGQSKSGESRHRKPQGWCCKVTPNHSSRNHGKIESVGLYKTEINGKENVINYNVNISVKQCE